MDKEMLRKEAEELQNKLAAVSMLLDEDGDEKEAGSDWMAAMAKARKELSKGGKKPSFKEVSDRAKELHKSSKGDEKEASEETEASTEEPTIVDQLDEIAEVLEQQNDPELLKVAYQLDVVSDVLEGKKTAAALESEPDEAYMKKYFRAGLREGDADEKSYMKEFNTDLSEETSRVPGHVSVEHKNASELPYRKVED